MKIQFTKTGFKAYCIENYPCLIIIQMKYFVLSFMWGYLN